MITDVHVVGMPTRGGRTTRNDRLIIPWEMLRSHQRKQPNQAWTTQTTALQSNTTTTTTTTIQPSHHPTKDTTMITTPSSVRVNPKVSMVNPSTTMVVPISIASNSTSMGGA